MLPNLTDSPGPSMPFSLPGMTPPGPTGTVVAPSPLAPQMPPEPPGASPDIAKLGIGPGIGSPMAGPVAGPLLPPVMGGDPASMQYDVETQVDGTLLLRLKNLDGTPGPVVQHLPAPKMKSGGKK